MYTSVFVIFDVSLCMRPCPCLRHIKIYIQFPFFALGVFMCVCVHISVCILLIEIVIQWQWYWVNNKMTIIIGSFDFITLDVDVLAARKRMRLPRLVFTQPCAANTFINVEQQYKFHNANTICTVAHRTAERIERQAACTRYE